MAQNEVGKIDELHCENCKDKAIECDYCKKEYSDDSEIICDDGWHFCDENCRVKYYEKELEEHSNCEPDIELTYVALGCPNCGLQITDECCERCNGIFHENERVICHNNKHYCTVRCLLEKEEDTIQIVKTKTRTDRSILDEMKRNCKTLIFPKDEGVIISHRGKETRVLSDVTLVEGTEKTYEIGALGKIIFDKVITEE